MTPPDRHGFVGVEIISLALENNKNYRAICGFFIHGSVFPIQFWMVFAVDSIDFQYCSGCAREHDSCNNRANVRSICLDLKQICKDHGKMLNLALPYYRRQ